MSNGASNSLVPTLSDVLNDIESRFLSNLPAEELASFDRLFFQLQEACWFYTDFYSDKHEHLPKLNRLKNFCAEFFRHSTLLQPFQANFDKLFEDFRSYVVQVPSCGCILLTPDYHKCLLVRAWKQQSWCFPKGKINEGETAAACAAREVLEEVGYDVTGKIYLQNALQSYVYGKKIRMFVVSHVPEGSEFGTRTRKEIGEIRWFALNELEALRTRQFQSKFTSVLPFLSKLRRWIEKQTIMPEMSSSSSSSSSFSFSSSSSSASSSSSCSSSSSSSSPFCSSSAPAPVAREISDSHLSRLGLGHFLKGIGGSHEVGEVKQSIVYPIDIKTLSAVSEVKPSQAPSHFNLSALERKMSQPVPPLEPSLVGGKETDECLGDMKEDGWSVQEMFETNERRFGVQSTVPPNELPVLNAAEQQRFDSYITQLGLGKGGRGPRKQEKQRVVAAPVVVKTKIVSSPPILHFKFDLEPILAPFNEMSLQGKMKQQRNAVS